jgi:hypothetical protein
METWSNNFPASGNNTRSLTCPEQTVKPLATSKDMGPQVEQAVKADSEDGASEIIYDLDDIPVDSVSKKSLEPYTEEPTSASDNFGNITHENILKSLVHQLIEQRDSLQQRLHFANAAIEEQQQAISSLSRTCATLAGERRLQAMATGKPKTQPFWIGGWLAGITLELTKAEKDWSEGKAQAALYHCAKVIIDPNTSMETLIEAKLLQVSILRSSNQGTRGLRYCEEALTLAYENHMLHLAGKAQYHRGLCLLQCFQDRQEDAAVAFLRAAGTSDHDEEVKVQFRLAQSEISQKRCK